MKLYNEKGERVADPSPELRPIHASGIEPREGKPLIVISGGYTERETKEILETYGFTKDNSGVLILSAEKNTVDRDEKTGKVIKRAAIREQKENDIERE